jgi:hypothetical protein
LPGGFNFCVGILRAEVFNTFVENTVEKRRSVDVNGSLQGASTFCTERSADAFVVQLADKILS